MRKLKIALVVLFAMVLSLGLFACKKKEQETEDPTGSGKTIASIASVSSLTFNDGDTQASFDAKKPSMKIEVRYEGANRERATLDGNACEITLPSNMWGNVGRYTATVKPIADNPNNVTGSMEIEIAHKFGAETDGHSVCSVCDATRDVAEENVVLEYEGFHSGISNSAAKFEPNGSQHFKEFGKAVNHTYTEGKDVPTVTVGQLEKGMTVTVKGTAVYGPPNDSFADLGYFFPIVGIADRTLNGAGKYNETFYKGGTSVIVRNDGHVLYDGIGTGADGSSAPTLLASLAGGPYDGSGAYGFPNYGSHRDADLSNPYPEGYGTPGTLPSSVSAWHDWYVYSVGNALFTADYYAEQNIELSWYYREDGIIEMTYKTGSGSAASYLRVYVKVPDSRLGYYDTILHGEYIDMTFSSYEVIQTRTPTELYFDGVDEANSYYYEYQKLDPTTIKVSMEYEQNPGHPEPFTLSADQVFATTAALVDGNVPADATWVSLATYTMSHEFTAYKIEVSKGGKTFTEILPGDTFTVYANAIASANGGDLGELKNNGKISALTVEAKAEGYILLTLGSGMQQAQAIEGTATWTNGTPTAAHKYIVLRLMAGSDEYSTFLTNAADYLIKSGDDNVPYILQLSSDNKTAILALALTEEMTQVTIEKLNPTKVVLDLTNLAGFAASSKVTGARKIGEDSTITVEYKLSATAAAGLTADKIRLVAGSGNGITLNQKTNAKDNWDGAEWANATAMISFRHKVMWSDDFTSIKFAFIIPAFTAGNYANIPDEITVRLDVNGTTQATDSIGYDFSKPTTHDGYHVFANGTTFYLLTTVEATQLSKTHYSGTLSLNLNAGGEETKYLKLLDLSYGINSISNALEFTSSRLPAGCATITVKEFGTMDDNSDVDSGIIILIAIDVTKLGVRTESATQAYGFQVNPDGETLTYDVVSGTNAITSTTPTGSYTATLIEEGSCQVEGLVATPITDGGNIVFYAAVHTIGGDHKWSGNTCELCGATRNTNVNLTNNENNNSFTVAEGSYAEISGTYNEVRHTGVYHGIETNIRNSGGTAFWVRVRSDRYSARESGNDSLVRLVPNAALNEAGTSSAVWPADLTGNFLDDTQLMNAKRAGSFKVIVSYADGMVTAEVMHWNAAGDLIDDHITYISLPQKPANITVRWRIDSYENPETLLANGPCTVVQGKTNSYVTSVSGLGNDTTYTLSANKLKVTATEKASELTSEAKATLTGTYGVPADAMTGYEYFVAFALNLSETLYTDEWFVSVKQDGKVVPGAFAKIAGNQVFVIILVHTGVMGSYTLDFANINASTLQGDMELDFTGVIASNITPTASSNLYLEGGTFTVTYTGSGLDKLVLAIGNNTLALDGIAKGDKLGNFTVENEPAIASNSITIVFKAGLANLSEKVEEFTLELQDAAGATLAQNTFNQITMQKDGMFENIMDGSWYVYAEGGMLYLITDAAANKSPESLLININNGAASKELVSQYDISASYADGKMTANGGGNLVRNATEVIYSSVGDKILIVYAIDVANIDGMGIGATDAYGFEFAGESNFYMVDADREITSVEYTAAGGTQETVATAGCDTYGLAATGYKGTGSTVLFYYNVVLTRTHNWSTAPQSGLYVCEDCGAIRKDGAVNGVWVAPDLLEGITETGVTISFWKTATDSGDWGMQALVSGLGNMIITMPNIDQWNNTLDTNYGTYYEKQFGLAVKGTNFYPNCGATQPNGSIPFSNVAGYVTIVVSPENGLSYYLNGEAVIHYAPDLAFPQGGQTYTVGDFLNMYLGLIERTGVTVAAAGMSASNMLIYLNDDMAATVTDGSFSSNAAGNTKAKALYERYLAESSVYGSDSYTSPKAGHGSNHTYTDGYYCDVCGALDPDHAHVYENSFCKYCGAEEEHQHTYTEDGVHCDICGKVDPNHTTHVYTNGVCACGYICRHNFGTTSGDCSICGQFTGTKDATWSRDLGSTVNGAWGENSKEVQLTKPAEGMITEAVFTATFDADTGNAGWAGVLTRLFDGGSAHTVFLQGNNNVLEGSWVDAGKVTRGELADYGVNKAGFTCRVTIRWEGTTVTSTYEVWEKGANTSLAPNKISVMTFSDVEVNTLYIWFGLDAVTSSNVTAVAHTYTAKA